MISILPAMFLMVLTAMLLIVLTAFGGLWLGAYIHHRGVSAGSGNKESFTGKVPAGEVFRLDDIDDLSKSPELGDMDEKTAARSQRFLQSIIGKGGV